MTIIDDISSSKEERQYELAKGMAADINRVLSLVDQINDRNMATTTTWDDLPDRIIDGYVGDPLDIEVTVSGSYSDWAYGDPKDMSVDYIEVTLGTGGPARGVRFYDSNRADAWHQDWGTPRVCYPLEGSYVELLAVHWGLEF